MKNLYTIALSTLFATFALAQDPVDVISNGSFEGWENGTLDVWLNEEGISVEQESNIFSEGQNSARITVLTAEQGTTDFTQSVPLEAGTNYSFSVDVYQVDSDSKVRVKVGSQYLAYSDPSIVGEWQTISGDFIASEGGSIDAGMRFYDTGDFVTTGTSTVYVDNFQLISGDVAQATEVSSIAELRSSELGQIYTLTSEAVLTMQQSNRNQKWIQDDTAAILIDDVNGVVGTSYDLYDGIAGITGTLSEYNGVMQFLPTEDPGANTSSDNDVELQIVSIEDFNANLDEYESELVAFDDVNIVEQGVWESGSNYTATSGGEDLAIRTQFYDADYIGEAIPTGVIDIIGIASEYNGSAQLFPRFTEDLTQTLAVSDIALDTTEWYAIQSGSLLKLMNVEVEAVEVYNVKGQKVVQGKSADLNIATLGNGMYIVRVLTTDGKVQTKKFLKK